MAVVMLYNPQNSISEQAGYAGYGEARAGQNGDPYGVPEAVLANPTDSASERVQWYDADSHGGLYTANVAVKLDINLATGVETLSVAGGTDDPVTLTDGPTGETISYVELTAGVQVAARVSWSNVEIQFYQDGVLQETVNPAGPTVDTRSTGGTAEQIETIAPASSSDDEVVITGTIKMLCQDGTYPGPDDMFVQGLVFANS